ncbi:MAG: DNA replication and repair protein RecF [Bacteroidetes bacterium]|jgi:DNA replication and repair protein RecF|nr:DNA replication and repair protein RecF [Bacteroidota bacterium]
MILRTLRLQSFRAHAETELTFAPKVNLLYGPNGVGKTNVLEALHYLCLTKSFTASRDTYALRKNSPYFQLEGTFDSTRRDELKVRLVYVPNEGKKIFVNGAPLDRLADIVGRLPVVVFSPEDHALTAEGPSERRRFLNNILSQAHPVYLDDLMKYRRARRQRNELLKQYKKRNAPPPDEVLAPWTEELVTLGSRVIARRLRFLGAFTDYLRQAYERVEDVTEKPSIEYDTIADFDAGATVEAIEADFREQLERTRQREQERGRTLLGPQRDELVFRLNDLEVRRYGSQGQHRTFGMALKLAQYFFLGDRLDEQPVLLLDDAFGKLDPERSAVFLELLQSDAIGQSVITATRRAPFAETVNFDRPAHCAIQIHRDATEAVTASP